MVRRCPKGLGTPVFDKLEAELARAIMSLPATKASRDRLRCMSCCAAAAAARLLSSSAGGLPDNAPLARPLSPPLPLQGFEIGSGFSGSRMTGSEHNDAYYMTEEGEVRGVGGRLC